MIERTKVIDEVCDWIELRAITFERAGATSEADTWRRVANLMQREFNGDNTDPEPRICGRTLVGQGTDTYDPICTLQRGHTGRCRPSEMYMP